MNPEKNTQTYFEKLKRMKLRDSSRARMESSLLEYARFHAVNEGVRVGDENRSSKQVPQRTSFIASLFNVRLSSMTAALLIALMIGGGTSYAAESSLPGDLLYGVKTEINENVQSAFAFSAKAEAELQARLAEERLREAEELAARGELDAEASAEIGTRLRAHYESATENSTEATADGDAETAFKVQASLESTFRAYAGILGTLSVGKEETATSALILDMNTYANDAKEAQTTATLNIKTNTSGILNTDITIGTDGKVDETNKEELDSDTTIDANTNLDTDINTDVLDTSIKTDTSLEAKTKIGL